MHATRFLCHCEILINAPDLNGVPVSAALVTRVLLRSTDLWAWGIKGLMITAPMLFWLFGPLYLLASTGLLVISWLILDWDHFGHFLPSVADEEAQRELNSAADSSQPAEITSTASL
jgi:hypothetical protein